MLGLLVLYAFVLKPALTGYTIDARNEGINLVLTSIITQIQQQGYVQIPVGNETLILVPYQQPQNNNVSLVG